MSAIEPTLINNMSAQDTEANEKTSSHRAEAPVAEKDVFRKVRTKDVCQFARQLATLLQAGMPLVPSLSALIEQLTESSGENTLYSEPRQRRFAQIIKNIRDNVNAGHSLADALAKHPNIFSPLFTSMVAAGEASGTLEDVLLRLAEVLENRLSLIGKIKSAVAYPLMMIIVAVGVVVFLLSYVVPSITQIFLEMNQTLPWPTRLLISTSAFVETHLIIIIIVACAIITMAIVCYRTAVGKSFADHYKLKLPLFGRVFLKIEIARLTRTLGMLLASGIDVLSSVEIAKGVVQNSFIADKLDSVKDRLSKGETIANSIKDTGLFPPVVLHIVATGQVSDSIEKGFTNIADMYEREVEMAAKTLTSLLEPVILMVMGIVVGFIVLAILLPIFEINQII